MNRVEVVLGVILLILAVTPTMGLMIISQGGGGSSTVNAYFIENGLPSGSTWSVTAGGVSYSGNAGSYIVVTSPSSTVDFSYTVPDVTYGGVTYAPNYPYGTLSASSTLTVTFSPEPSSTASVFSWDFVSTGLSGAGFSVTMDGQTEYAITSASPAEAIFAGIPAGTYSFTITPPSDYSASPSSGTVTISGNGQTIISFSSTSSTSSSSSGSSAPTMSWTVNGQPVSAAGPYNFSTLTLSFVGTASGSGISGVKAYVYSGTSTSSPIATVTFTQSGNTWSGSWTAPSNGVYTIEVTYTYGGVTFIGLSVLAPFNSTSSHISMSTEGWILAALGAAIMFDGWRRKR
ncbi:MAG: hypothetical protein JRN22_00755 [Nitrososphaerota archaeon]|nr:hypothetical protein [Nitrososphaerota archaeon]